eukprot:TRINITY_DN427_c0_g6_i1.p1 TRINITY_DN427_c0_g6~~TRINITY_DN427_c0_g6_i1.p1  ORF type:complete len:289 (+),score=27.86 TRINITY_DN427_c0_g6_i1:58-924(+)
MSLWAGFIASVLASAAEESGFDANHRLAVVLDPEFVTEPSVFVGPLQTHSFTTRNLFAGGYLTFSRNIYSTGGEQVARRGSTAQILNVLNKDNIDVLVDEATRFVVNRYYSIVKMDNEWGRPGEAFTLSTHLSSELPSGSVCQVLWVDRSTFNSKVRCDNSENAYNVTRRNGYYAPGATAISENIQFRPDLKLFGIGAVMIMNNNETATVFSIPGKQGKLASAYTSHGIAVEINHTSGVFVEASCSCACVVHLVVAGLVVFFVILQGIADIREYFCRPEDEYDLLDSC